MESLLIDVSILVFLYLWLPAFVEVLVRDHDHAAPVGQLLQIFPIDSVEVPFAFVPSRLGCTVGPVADGVVVRLSVCVLDTLCKLSLCEVPRLEASSSQCLDF